MAVTSESAAGENDIATSQSSPSQSIQQVTEALNQQAALKNGSSFLIEKKETFTVHIPYMKHQKNISIVFFVSVVRLNNLLL